MYTKHDPPLVLVADDQVPATIILERIFKHEGYDVKVVYNGKDALEAARELLPDLILLDIMMPQLNGFEVLSTLRENVTTANIPTILITAMGEPSDIAKGLNLGADDYLAKPFHPRELLARAEAKMKARRLEETLHRRTQELEALLRVSEELNQHLEMDALLDLLIYLALDLLPGDIAGIYQVYEDGQIAAYNVKNKVGNLVENVDHNGIVQAFTSETDAILWPDNTQTRLLSGYSCGMAVPLKHWNTIIGFLMIAGEQPYDRNHLRLFRGIGRQATLAVHNADLYKIQANYAEHLKETVDKRTEELRSAQQLLIHSEKLASAGRLAASVAHEINNPLFPIRINLEHMLEDIQEGVKIDEKDIRETLNSVERISRIVNRLLEFTRKPVDDLMELEAVDLNQVIDNIVNLNRKFFEKENVVTELHIPTLPHVEGSKDQLEQVFMNLVLNAKAAMPEGGTLSIEAYAEEDVVVIKCKDTGVGIEQNVIDKIFEPLFSTKEDGTGLGLFVSYGIIQNHKGTIEVTSDVGKGAVFTIKLPIVQAAHTTLS